MLRAVRRGLAAARALDRLCCSAWPSGKRKRGESAGVRVRKRHDSGDSLCCWRCGVDWRPWALWIAYAPAQASRCAGIRRYQAEGATNSVPWSLRVQDVVFWSTTGRVAVARAGAKAPSSGMHDWETLFECSRRGILDFGAVLAMGHAKRTL